MLKLSILLLLCLFALHHLSSAQVNFAAAPDFPTIQLYASWYEQAFIDNPNVLQGDPCSRYTFTHGCGADNYQLGFNDNSEDGPIVVITNTIAPSEEPGRFNIATSEGAQGSLFVLAYDPLFDWIIIGDTVTAGGFMSALSKTNARNEALFNRTLEVAAQYNFTVFPEDYNPQSSTCNYTGILLEQQAARQSAAISGSEATETIPTS